MKRTPPATRLTPVRLWRWRRNPLRRHSDLVEGWVILVTWTLAVLGAVLAGWAAAHSVDRALDARRAQVRSVAAVLVDDAAKSTPAGTGYDDDRVWSTARWIGTDGASHLSRTKVHVGTPAGTRVTVWTNGGRAVPPPASAAEAMLQTVLTGALVAQVGGTAVWAGGRLVRGSLVRRQLSEWDREWRRVGPEWRKLSGGRG